jgi:hypothetical protein
MSFTGPLGREWALVAALGASLCPLCASPLPLLPPTALCGAARLRDGEKLLPPLAREAAEDAWLPPAAGRRDPGLSGTVRSFSVILTKLSALCARRRGRGCASSAPPPASLGALPDEPGREAVTAPRRGVTPTLVWLSI